MSDGNPKMWFKLNMSKFLYRNHESVIFCKNFASALVLYFGKDSKAIYYANLTGLLI
jgi:hypothetical protein